MDIETLLGALFPPYGAYVVARKNGLIDDLQVKLHHLVGDPEIAAAIEAVYTTVTSSEYLQKFFPVDGGADIIARIVWAYITYFVKDPSQKLKYFSDKHYDRKDPYRADLVSRIAKVSKTKEKQAMVVLTSLYHGTKHGLVAKHILEPRLNKRFYKEDWWYNESVFAIIYKFTQTLCNEMLNILEAVGHATVEIVKGAAEAVKSIGKISYGVLKYAPYALIAGGGAYLYLQYKRNPMLAPLRLPKGKKDDNNKK